MDNIIVNKKLIEAILSRYKTKIKNAKKYKLIETKILKSLINKKTVTTKELKTLYEDCSEIEPYEGQDGSDKKIIKSEEKPIDYETKEIKENKNIKVTDKLILETLALTYQLSTNLSDYYLKEDTILKIFSDKKEITPSEMKAIKETISLNENPQQQAALRAGQNVGQVVNNVANRTGFNQAYNAVTQPVQNAAAGVQNVASNVGNTLSTAYNTAAPGVTAAANQLGSAAGNVLQSAGQSVQSNAIQPAQQFAAGIQSTAPQVANAAVAATAVGLGVAGTVGAYQLITHISERLKWKRQGCSMITDDERKKKCELYVTNIEANEYQNAFKKCKDDECRRTVMKKLQSVIMKKQKLIAAATAAKDQGGVGDTA